MRRKNIPIFIVAPLKGHEFHRACANVGGEFIQISPASPHCINVMAVSYTHLSELPPLSFAVFNSVMLVIIGVCANGAVALITLILVIILAWNYLKLLLEAAERYVLLGVLVYTAPVAFSMGARDVYKRQEYNGRILH